MTEPLEDGIWLVWDGDRLFLPYPGGRSTGSKEAADAYVDRNQDYQAVHMRLEFEEEGHECVWEHTHSEPNFGAHYECRICMAKTP